jgi:hypothetical protein
MKTAYPTATVTADARHSRQDGGRTPHGRRPLVLAALLAVAFCCGCWTGLWLGRGSVTAEAERRSAWFLTEATRLGIVVVDEERLAELEQQVAKVHTAGLDGMPSVFDAASAPSNSIPGQGFATPCREPAEDDGFDGG